MIRPMPRIVRAFALVVVLGAASSVVACANPVDPPQERRDGGTSSAQDGGVAVPDDAGTPATLVLESANLAPATNLAENAGYRLRGHLQSSEVRTATNTEFKIRGGFVPLTR